MVKFLTTILVVVVLYTSGYGAEEPLLTDKEKADLDKIVQDLKAAIVNRDFTVLKSDIPIVKTPLFWTPCGGTREDMSFDEMVSRLKTTSSGGEILVNPKTEFTLSGYIETKGWNDEVPYLYFEFASDRWYGVILCDERDSDFIHAQGEEFPALLAAETEERENKKAAAPVGMISVLRRAIRTGDYEPMREFVPSGKVYIWGYCGPGDSMPEEYSFAEISRRLLELGQEVDIKVLTGPELGGPYGDSAAVALIETGVWKGDYPYIEFVFELILPDRIWAWTGVNDCRQVPGDRPWENY